MNILVISLGIDDFKIINEVTAKVISNETVYIYKLVPYVNMITYLEIQNAGVSKHIARVYQIEHFYIEELDQKLIFDLTRGRKHLEYDNQKSLYLVKFEHINGIPYFDYYGNHISVKFLYKLIKETFTGLQTIHNAGYYHGDLGMPDNIILEGTLDNWQRAVIIDIEGGKITNEKQIQSDIETLSYCIWQIIVGNIAETEAEDGNVITPEHPMFVDLVKNNINQFKQYRSYLELLLWIFLNKPTTVEILKRI